MYIYKAFSNGTSTFAVVGGKIIDVSPQPSDDVGGIPWFIVIGAVIMIVFLIVAFLFKSGFLYLEDTSQGKKNKRPPKKKK